MGSGYNAYRRKVRSVPCPKCRAPVGAPCIDWRSYDRDLFGNRVHVERAKARAPLPDESLALDARSPDAH
jgi:hypothetical protein